MMGIGAVLMQVDPGPAYLPAFLFQYNARRFGFSTYNVHVLVTRNADRLDRGHEERAA